MKTNQQNSIVMVQNQAQTKPVPKLLLYLMLLLSLTYLAYTLRLISSTTTTTHTSNHHSSSISATICSDSIEEDEHSKTSYSKNLESKTKTKTESLNDESPTEIKHIAFGIAASAKLWKKRKEYTKLWFRRSTMLGVVWLDQKPPESQDESDFYLPPARISGNDSEFPYSNKKGHRSAVRISRIASETFRLDLFPEARWFVMGDDDTVFFTENLVRVLRRYDHREMYYIGSSSESHVQNIQFSYAMAYGGGGFAISRPLAAAMAGMQDRCIKRYPSLYGSDERVHACMAELGVPLTREVGFHQFDVYGSLLGLLAAHPVAPLVSVHHLDVVEPIFPDATTRASALRRILAGPARLDSAAVAQQSVCYHRRKHWTVSVSWGYAVQVFRGVISAREMEMPTRTFLNWYKREDYKAYSFNTRPVARNPCQKPFVFYLSGSSFDRRGNRTVTDYARHRVAPPVCTWKMDSPGEFDAVRVYKRRDPNMWDRAPRRNCCRILDSHKNGTMLIDVGVCRDGEIVEL